MRQIEAIPPQPLREKEPIPKGRPKIWWNWDGVVAKFELGVERVSVTAWA